MRMVDLIRKKRYGKQLLKEEIDFIIKGFTNGEIPDYQMSSLAMAIVLNGMSEEETTNLTMAMVDSGEILAYPDIKGVRVDKHSTGGVGDKTTLIVTPLVAAMGVPVAKMSGRGLGHTGGTVDKLESIPGFRIDLTPEQFVRQVNQSKIALTGQTGNLVPADKKFYALRDVTGTVESIPLIASSIMSKKIASGSDAIVLDVKVGSGAFMKDLNSARELAEIMVHIGNNLGRRTIAVLSNMEQPLGFEVGNANEIKEVVEILRGKAVADLKELSLTIASHMVVAGGRCGNFAEAYQAVKEALESGKALDKFREFVKAQGGDPAIIDDLGILPQAKHHLEVRATRAGYVQSIDAEQVGVSAMMLGAGRQRKEDSIDYAAGITLHKKVGDQVVVGEIVFTMHTNRESWEDAEGLLKQSFTISEHPVEGIPVILDVVGVGLPASEG
ncbi:pyrimidine-nucleoside phosphorylase [Ammoniphilus resinae]|uniref:Pyrimidine-nucleoside phosphorylase n=1 Tax=Ammoniphilus resinae TaxID=861532 RepID=A0ABS4GRI8_9BACL|nr:pyrimidine-nucleoside phosphorylase [Ammoniphilus resinae]MBP1932891.1 pyrimidine-nucleoside phosphorylase [Ammoniphilus resinae]